MAYELTHSSVLLEVFGAASSVWCCLEQVLRCRGLVSEHLEIEVSSKSG